MIRLNASILIAAPFLSLVLALLCGTVQNALRKILTDHPALVFVAPAILSGMFCACAAALDVLSFPLTAAIFVYTFAPTICAFLVRRHRPPVWVDFGVILLLWLPLEFSVGARWVPGPAQGLLHIAAYGVSVILGFVLMLLFRRLDGIKYNLPRRRQDFVYPLIGLAAVAPVLIVIGRALGFLDPFHVPANLSALRVGAEFLFILAATALPEEILFRGFIQNCIMQKFGAGTRSLLLAALIFGCAHFNNGPGSVPNWRYAILATIAGIAYGKVFEKGSSIFASVFLHALVN